MFSGRDLQFDTRDCSFWGITLGSIFFPLLLLVLLRFFPSFFEKFPYFIIQGIRQVLLGGVLRIADI